MIQISPPPINLPFQLTEQQQFALNQMEDFINSSKPFFGLYGYAGTGKSTIIFLLLKVLIQRSKRIVLTAPTNKALGVLRKMAAENGVVSADFFTIHQLLGLAPVNQGTSKILKQVSPSLLHMYDTIFLDECSMVTAELWNIIVERISGTLLIGANRKLIVMGDPAQLPPVGDGENEIKSLAFGVADKAILTEVVRQGAASPLLEFVTACRTAVKSPEVFKPFRSSSPDKSNGAFLVKEETLLKYALKKFSHQFAANPDCFRILCYTNERVAYWNNKIREKIYGQNAPRFIIGERLIVRNPVTAPDGKTIILPTSTEFKILDFEEERYAGYKAWKLKVVTDEGMIRQIYTLHEDDLKRYKQDNSRLLKNAKQNPSLWKAWYNHNELFADIRNCWALTIHNSQGSTYTEAGLDGRNINLRAKLKEGSIRECNQLWYVAASRARKRVFVSH